MTRAGRALAALLAGLLLARLWIASRAGLANDEAYYWQWARHLAWGYYDHPPLVAWGIAAGRWLLGDSELGVRLASVVLSTAALGFVYDLARQYAGARAGLWAAGATAVAPLLAAGGALATPDVPLFCFWAATLALAARALTGAGRSAWLAAGLAFGLGALGKYAMILLAPALGLALLSTPRGRAALRTPWPWLGAALALLVCTPLVLGSLATASDSLVHALSKGFGVAGGRPATHPLQSFAEFVGVQALVVTPILFALAMAAGWRGARALRGATGGAGRAGTRSELLPLLVYPAALPLLVFAVASAFSESYANWTAPAYATLFALLGAELAAGAWPRRRGWVIAAFALPALATLHLYVEAVYPLVPYPKGAMTKVRDRRPLAEWAQGLRESRGERGLEAEVLAAGYQTASVLAFYLPDHPETDAPFETRGGSQYRIWHEARGRARLGAGSAWAWFFTRAGRDRDGARARELLVDPELVDSYVQTRRGRELRTIHAWFGRLADAPQAGAEEAPLGRWRHSRPAPGAAGEPTPEQREEIERLEAIGYVSGSRPATRAGGVRVHDADRSWQGLNFYVSGHAPEARLMDMTGQVLWRWSYAFADALPDFRLPPHSRGDAHWRRAHLLPNGDVLAIYEGFALIKLDRDSKLLWSYAGRPHHDLDVDERGRIYLLTRRTVSRSEIRPELPVLDDFVTVLSPDGEELRSVSILEAYQRSPFADQLSRMDRSGDLFHTNTIEVLDGSHAGLSEAFRAGNVLIAPLQMDAIAVVDLEAGQVVWSQLGGWSKPHQPTFTDAGHMLIFDNQRDTSRVASRVVEFDPLTKEVLWEYAGGRDGPLRSRTCGSVQRLPNGNTLVVESDNGRAFELTPDKEIVWEFASPHRAGARGELVATLFDLVRLPPDAAAWLAHSR